jgi:uncharacterized protein with FMN-binding domain
MNVILTYQRTAVDHNHLSREMNGADFKRLCSPIFFLSILAVLLYFVLGCTMAPIRGAKIEEGKLADGIYEGSYRHGPNSAKVRVIISQGKIVDIELIKHFASWKGDKANEIIPQRIIAEQSTAVDAVSGATNSSRVIMNAVQEALERAYRE